jgi:hypothetical protein
MAQMIRGVIAEVRTTKAVGKCIYCGSLENLHDEHCIPESLNGFYVLGGGSCGDCGKITGRFEGDYARNSMLPVRTAWKMNSKRSKTKRPTEFPMRFKKGGREQTIMVPVEDHYSVIPMIEIGPPGKYPNGSHTMGLRNRQYKLNPFRIRPDEHIDYLVKKYGADEISVDFQIDVNGFLRMIAKIAYCYTVRYYGLSSIGEKYVVPAILGTANDVWDWVGSDGEQMIHHMTSDMKTDHIVATWMEPDGELRARVKLFKKSLTPEYEVIVGRLTEQVYGFYQSVGRKLVTNALL